MKYPTNLFLATLCLMALPFTAKADTIQLTNTTLQVDVVATDLHVPWEILWGPDDMLWVTERDGVVSRINPLDGTKSVLVNVMECYEYSESGLMGMCFHPDFENQPYVYLVHNYLLNGNDNRVKLARYEYNGSTLFNEQVLLLEVEGSNGGGNHSGSRIRFLPDGTLLMTTGERYVQDLAQDMSSLNGKVLRFNDDGSIPADNPDPNSYIYSLGHRNPQGLVVASNGIIYSSEHGSNNNDEINILEPDRNFGWPRVQGFCDNNFEDDLAFCTSANVKEPIFAWTPTIAVAGMTYYDHPAIPEWENDLLVCSLGGKSFAHLELSADGLTVTQENQPLNAQYGRLRSICKAPDGSIYVGSSNDDGRANWIVTPSDVNTPFADDDRIYRIYNPDYVSGPALQAKVLLQGAANGNTMSVGPDYHDLIPAAQPYNRAPWNYAGSEIIPTIPPNMVDWVLVELRDPTDPNTIRATEAALLLSDGSIVDTRYASNPNNNQLVFDNFSEGLYYVVVRHRNHYAIMSQNLVFLPSASLLDLTDPTQINGGATQLTQANPSLMKAGDFDSDGLGTFMDFNAYLGGSSDLLAYQDEDVDFNAIVTVLDFNLYQQQYDMIAVPQVRY